jgi:HSP20 family protein
MSALIRYNEPRYTLSNWFDSLFDDSHFYYNAGRDLACTQWPNVDIVENEKDYTIHADLPGLEKKDVKIEIKDGVLSISGEKKQEKKEKEKGKYHYYQRSYGSFKRSFALSDDIDEKKINAKLNNGQLELVFQKKEKVEPKAIEIKVD